MKQLERFDDKFECQNFVCEEHHKGIKSYILDMLDSAKGKEFNGENNPMLNEYTRGYNEAVQSQNKKIEELKKLL